MVSNSPSNVIDVFLQPGDLYFGDRETRIRTVLGSCVSMVFWHPRLHVGGMCHYMLPCRPDRQFGELDGRYADEATALLFREMRQIGTQPSDYQVKVFGGGNMFPGQQRRDDSDHVGARNVDAARDIVRAHGLTTVCEHLAGSGHRNVIFDVWSGNVWVKHQAPVQQVEPVRATELRAPAVHAAANVTLACVAAAA